MEASCILFNTGRETAHSEDEESEKGLKGMKLKKWLTGVLAAAMALSLAACSDGGAESADAGSEDSITLGFAQVGSESEWRTANTDNIKAAAEAAGVTLQFSDAQQKQENQIKAIRSFIASDVDVISFCPIVETGWDTVLQEAKDAGIPVVLVDRGVTADPSLYVTHIFADALKEGANAFNWVDEYMTAEGKTPRAGGDQFQVIAGPCSVEGENLIRIARRVKAAGTVGSSVAADRLQGFTDAMAESPNSGKYNVICSQTGEYTRAKGMEVMESFLKSDGDKIDILFSCNGDMALGAIQAIEAAGLKPGEDIVIVSIDAAKGEFNAMIEGKMNCAVEHTPNFGETLMETAKKIVAGEEVPATIELEEGIFPADIAEQEMPNRTY